MKKRLLILSSLVAIVACWLSFSMREPVNEHARQAALRPESDTAAVPLDPTIQPPEQPAPEAPDIGMAPTAPLIETNDPPELLDSFVQTVTHAHADDFSWGQFSNTMAAETLRLSPAAFEGASAATGTFTSGGIMRHRPFNTITLDYQADIPPGSALQFEIHTLSANETWSEWQEIGTDHLNRAIALTRKAKGWQYRFTFSAPAAAAGGPQVQSVTITTENTGQTSVTASRAR